MGIVNHLDSWSRCAEKWGAPRAFAGEPYWSLYDSEASRGKRFLYFPFRDITVAFHSPEGKEPFRVSGSFKGLPYRWSIKGEVWDLDPWDLDPCLIRKYMEGANQALQNRGDPFGVRPKKPYAD